VFTPILEQPVFAISTIRSADVILGSAMSREPRILEPQCEWTAGDVADEQVWTESFDAAELAELDAALRHAIAKSDDVLRLGREDFPLPTLACRLARIERELIDGRGFVRLRGVDRGAYTQTEMELTNRDSHWSARRTASRLRVN